MSDATVSLKRLVTPEDRRAALVADARRLLEPDAKALPPVWFYDETGSRLFDEITRLPEYYLTRAEREILTARAADIAELTGAHTLVEIGSGTSDKTRLLLDAMAERGSLRYIVLLDISEEVLCEAAEWLSTTYGVDVHAVVGDLRSHLSEIGPGTDRLWAFLGSTIGNFTPTERRRLLRDFEAAMDPSDFLLLGTDLVKSPERLRAAYDDPGGVTAAFNRNVLSVLNHELHAHFDPSRFDHVARWNPDREWMEIRLRAREPHSVELADLDGVAEFVAGEEIWTEISAKFRPDKLAEELAGYGFEVAQRWQDAAGDFQLSLLRAQ